MSAIDMNKLALSLMLVLATSTASAAPTFTQARAACTSATDTFMKYVDFAQSYGDDVDAYSDMWAEAHASAVRDVEARGETLNPDEVEQANKLVKAAWLVREGSLNETRETSMRFCMVALVGEFETL